MNKSQLIEALAGHFDGNKKQAGEALQSVLDTIARELVKGEKVAITGFGAFERVVRPSRMVRNPRTGERKRAKKTAVPKFKAGAELKAIVSGEKKLPKLAAPAGKAAAVKRSTGASSPTSKATAGKTTASRSSASKSTATGATKTAARKGAAKSAATKTASATKSAAKTTTRKAPASRAAKTASRVTSSARKSPATKTTTRRAAKKS